MRPRRSTETSLAPVTTILLTLGSSRRGTRAPRSVVSRVNSSTSQLRSDCSSLRLNSRSAASTPLSICGLTVSRVGFCSVRGSIEPMTESKIKCFWRNNTRFFISRSESSAPSLMRASSALCVAKSCEVGARSSEGTCKCWSRLVRAANRSEKLREALRAGGPDAVSSGAVTANGVSSGGVAAVGATANGAVSSGDVAAVGATAVGATAGAVTNASGAAFIEVGGANDGSTG